MRSADATVDHARTTAGRWRWRLIMAWWAAAVTVALGGCGAPLLNPQFPLTSHDARLEMEEMLEGPLVPPRPIVVVGGLYDPGFIGLLASDLRRLTHPDVRVISVTFIGKGTFDECRDHLVECVQRSIPSTWLHETTEVDVVAYSMGGLVARYAAMPDAGRPRLNIARLWTIATPHRGAKLAALPTFDQRVIEMRCGSTFLQALDDGLAEADYPIIPYARQGDAVVGTENTAPPGCVPIWVPNPPFGLAHLGAYSDHRIVADIARQLRGEPSFVVREVEATASSRNNRTIQEPAHSSDHGDVVY